MVSARDVRLVTSSSTIWIDEWCGRNCRGDWSVSVDTVLNGKHRKEVIVNFERIEERTAFQEYQAKVTHRKPR